MEHAQNYQQMLLNKVFTQKLQQNEEQNKMWTDYKKRHKKVIEGLQVFPLTLSESCIVPIGKRAFMRGKLIHTNEILVCLGDGYFAKYSASQAIALCNRRIEWADEMLKSLEAERNLYEMRQILPLRHDVFGNEDRNDLLEHWNENELDEWRVRHKQREKEYRQKLARLKKEEEADDRTEEDLFKRLDELELEEDLENEILQEAERERFYDDDLQEGEAYDESEEDLSDCDEITTEMLEEELKKLKDIRKDRITSASDASSSNTIPHEIPDTESEQSDLVNSSREELQNRSPEPNDTSESAKNKRRVSFVESLALEDQCDIEEESSMPKDDPPGQDEAYDNENSVDDDIIRIEFSHTLNTSKAPESSTTEVRSPVDIYKMFSIPKSILKRSPNDIPNGAIAPVNESNSTDTEEEDIVNRCEDFVNRCVRSFEMNDVWERTVTSPANNIVSEKKDEKKPMSRFKMRRTGILGN